MFDFFKKKPKKELKETVLFTEEEISELKKEISILLKQLNNISEENKEEKAKLLEKIGVIQSDAGLIDDSIKTLENSLEYELSIGDGYKKLMSLYNQKRAESARNGDDEGIDYYMNKMDDMRQIAKKVTLSR